jgi:hypothetical protein
MIQQIRSMPFSFTSSDTTSEIFDVFDAGSEEKSVTSGKRFGRINVTFVTTLSNQIPVCLQATFTSQ